MFDFYVEQLKIRDNPKNIQLYINIYIYIMYVGIIFFSLYFEYYNAL